MSTYGPGSTIGILGGGQLGRMSILAGRRLGYRFVVMDPVAGGPASMVADAEINAPFDDLDAVRRFAEMVDVVTLEFENIPADTVSEIETVCPVRPGWEVLHTCQNRLREKTFLRDNDFPCVPFAVIRSFEDLCDAVDEIGLPAVLKTADFGYDGKGQVKINEGDDLEMIWNGFSGSTAILEKWIQFIGEYSVVCARRPGGETAVFPPAYNVHRNHILHSSQVPSGLSPELEKAARSLALDIAAELEVIGLIAVELFLTASGWMVNEMAPRPHNSGHYSFDACLTSQFEQHIRAVCGLPLGDTKLLSPVVMVNLLGDVWKDNGRHLNWPAVLESPHAKLHLYGKQSARPGRKMGHYCVLADSEEAAEAEAEAIFAKLQQG